MNHSKTKSFERNYFMNYQLQHLRKIQMDLKSLLTFVKKL